MDRDRGGFRGRGGFGGGGFGGGAAPVNVGDELNVKIEAVGEKGDGIAKKDGFVLFVPGAKAGQEVRIRVTKVLRKVGFAEIVGDKGSEPEAKEKEEAYEDTENFGEESSESSEDAPQPSDEEKEPSDES